MNTKEIHSEHYSGKIETIEFIEDKLTGEQYLGYLLGNITKYLSRYNKNGSKLSDLQKAYTYLGWAIEFKKNEANAIKRNCR